MSNTQLGSYRAGILYSALFLSMSQTARADDIGTTANHGVGLAAGLYAQGLSGKLYLDPNNAVQVVVGHSGVYGNDAVTISGDWIREFDTLYEEETEGRLFWGAGAGAGIMVYTHSTAAVLQAGLSGVVELGWHFHDFPLELVLDWRPTLILGESSGLYLYGMGAAMRYFFDESQVRGGS